MSLCGLKTYEATVIKTGRARWGDGHTGQRDRREIPKTHPLMCAQITFDRSTKKLLEEIQPFQQIGATGRPPSGREKNYLSPFLKPDTKIKSKRVMDLKVIHQTMKLVGKKKNIGENLQD